MQPTLEDQAIKAALEGRWTDSVNINQTILHENPQSVPALNRLAKAYSQLGENDKAIEIYEKVLCIDKFNTIAQKNCHSLKNSPCKPNGCAKIINTDFIEEPGKTKTVPLVRLGDAKTLSNLQPGQLINLVVKNHYITATTQQNTYIGVLPDNISYRLKQFISGGNTFQVVVRTASNNQVTVFMKETSRAPQFADTPSF